jgi:hypothetical protein
MDNDFAEPLRVSPLLSVLPAAITVLCVAAPAAAAPTAGAPNAAAALALRSGGFYAGPPVQLAAASDVRHRQDVLGRATLRRGKHGWAVRELQLALAWQGFPSGGIDGMYGPRLTAALRRFQHARRLAPDGVAGPATIALLRAAPRRPSMPLGWPLLARVGDAFGPRGGRFHAGIDLPAAAGTPVAAAAAGRVVWAGTRAGGWGKLVTLAHGNGVRTLYAHLSTIHVRVGDWVAGGTVVGRVGSTGDATGPHLHFEVRLHGAAIDPLRALVRIPAALRARASLATPPPT